MVNIQITNELYDRILKLAGEQLNVDNGLIVGSWYSFDEAYDFGVDDGARTLANQIVFTDNDIVIP